MDMNNLLIVIAIFLPLIFACYLLVKKINLSLVNKKILKYGLLILNLFSFIVFLIKKLFFKDFLLTLNIFRFENVKLETGININNINIDFLLFAAFLFLLISVYSYLFFKKKKQFVLTKQRYNILFSLFIFLTYGFIVSIDLIQSLVFYILSGILIFIFAYCDIFKNNADYNITRFYKILCIGDIAFLSGILLVFKNVLNSGYNAVLNYNALNLACDTLLNSGSYFELNILILCFVAALITRLFTVPCNCFYSFSMNSSNLLYVILMSAVTPIFAYLMFFNVLSCIQLDLNFKFIFEMYLLFSLIVSLILILFEKSFKIIFGHLTSCISALFIFLYLKSEAYNVIYLYFFVCIILFSLISYLLINDKTSFKKRIINVKKGFLIERFYIYMFEKLPLKLSNIFVILNKIITENIFYGLVVFFKLISYYFILKTKKASIKILIKDILIIFVLCILLVIFIALFGNFGEV